MAFITVYFPGNIIAHVNVNWLSPVKVRTTLIGGRDKMLVWNDLEPDEKIKVYDKGVEITSGRRRLRPARQLPLRRRVGAEGRRRPRRCNVELEYFVDCIRSDQTPINDGAAGLRVVRLLEAADQSLKNRGRARRRLTGRIALASVG